MTAISNAQADTHGLTEDNVQENLSQQSDEIEVLRSMYDTDFQIEDETPTFSITVNIADPNCDTDEALLSDDEKLERFLEREKWEATLVVSFNLDYPSTAPPIYHLSVPWLSREKVDLITNELHELYISHCGEPIVYFWVEKLRDMLIDLKPDTLPTSSLVPVRSKLLEDLNIDPVSTNKTDDYDITPKTKLSPAKKQEGEVQEQLQVPEIFTGEPLTDRKSTFQAHLAVVRSIQDVKGVLRKLYENKKIAGATHNMYAYRIEKDSVVQIQDCEDDGETHAGGRLLHLLQILDCRNVLVVVSRWYGGIMLHGDRFKHINNVARVLLEKHDFIRKGSTNSSTGNAKHKSK